MRLLVDLGNTRLKWGLWSEGGLVEQRALVWFREKLASQLDHVWRDYQPDKVVVCSVADTQLNDVIAAWTQRAWGLVPVFAESSRMYKTLVSAYEVPEQLGNDRWAAMLGGQLLCETGFTVIDCGTAVTVDLVSSQGRHLGGCIFPGLQTMRESLGRRAYNLPVASGQTNLFASNTEDAISGGTLYTIAGGIDRMLELATAEANEPLTHFITGGDAQQVQLCLHMETCFVESLVLMGLSLY
ncbi:MAG TPA: hypothetical protein DCZ12_08435 [Gammaproteobacteria bacterium]|nr:hypothetical protein [Gammaproteobacteria bacterium]